MNKVSHCIMKIRNENQKSHNNENEPALFKSRFENE